MAAQRYWEMTNLEAYGRSGLSITELHLLAGLTRVDASATLTSSVAPDTGSLANLKDDNLGTGAYWSPASLKGLTVRWDFGGSPQDISDIRVGAADSASTMLYSVKLRSSPDAATWTDEQTIWPIAYPGARTKTVSEQRGLWNPFDSLSGSQVQRDKSLVNSNIDKVRGSTFRSSGTLQFEIQAPPSGGAFGGLVGVVPAGVTLSGGIGTEAGAGLGWGYSTSAQKATNATLASYGATWTNNDVIGVVINFTAGTLTFYKNGVSQGTAFTDLAGKTVAPARSGGNTAGSDKLFRLRVNNFTYPIAGATAWDDRQLIKTEIFGRAMLNPLRRASSAAAPGAASLIKPAPLYRSRGTASPGAGNGRVKGTTKDKGTPSNIPVSELVRLYRKIDGLLVRAVFSEPGTGNYSFDYVDEKDTYFVVAFDHDLLYNAVARDNLNLANGGVELLGAAPVLAKSVQVRNGEVAQQLTGSSINVMPPLGTQVGDLLMITLRRLAAVTGTGGATLLNASGALNTTMHVEVYSKVVTAPDLATGVAFTFGASAVIQAQAVSFYTANGATPVVATTAMTTINSAALSFTIPAVTAPSDETGMLAYASVGKFAQQLNPEVVSLTPDTAWSSRAGVSVAGQLVWSATREVATGATVGAAGNSFNFGTSPNNWAAMFNSVLKPA